MKLSCPAKINLFLKITNRLPNGYHELESLFAFLDLRDDLEISLSNKFHLEINGEFANLIDLENNLFTKILDFFIAKFSISRNLHIKITKNIPVGAGLGGGSSNAAYFIKALNQIFTLNLSKIELQKISLNFGSDIPFFFEEKASIIRGIGEKISNFDNFEPILTLLVSPKNHLLSRDVYVKFDGNFSQKNSDEELKNKNIFDLINFSNDLTKPAIKLLPEIDQVLNELKKQNPSAVKMSGSGSSCFAVFANKIDLKSATDNIRKKFPDFFIKETKILPTPNV